MNEVTRKAFLERLHQEAAAQAKLNSTQLLPDELAGILAVIGMYPWQFLLVVSGLTAAGLELWIALL